MALDVAARDAALNVATGYAGTVHFASDDPAAVLPADYTFTAADAGRHSFEVGLRAPGAPAVRVSDGVNGITASATSRTVGWCSTGPDHADITALAGDPQNPSVLYAGTFGAGLFKTTDGGATWASSGLGNVAPFVTSIVIDPRSPSTVYAGGHIGIYKSVDAGGTWIRMDSADVVALVMDPSAPDTLYAATGAGVNGFGALRSSNAGLGWTPVNQGLPATTVGMTALAIDPAAPSRLYAAFQDQTLHVTTDAGAHWSLLTVPGPIVGRDILALAVDSHSVVFMGTNFGSYQSGDQGASWSQEPTLGGLTTVDPRAPSIVYSGGIGQTMKTVDGGANWTAVNVDAATAIAAGPTGAAFAGTRSRGVLRSTDGFTTSVSANRGLRGSLAKAVLVDAAQPANVFAASEGNFSASSDGGATWNETSIAFDVIQLVRDPQAPATFYAAGLNGAQKSIDSGAHWTFIGPFLQPSGAPQPTMPVAMAPDNPATLYFGTQQAGVFKTVDGGKTLVQTGLANGWIWSLATDPNHPGTVYASTFNGPFFKTVDGGANWTALSGLPANPDFIPILVLPDSTVIVAFDGAAFRSRDGGSSWTRVAGLPPFFFPMGMAADPATPGTVFAVLTPGTVFKSVDSGATWHPTNGSLPDQQGIFSLAVSGNTLYAAAQGQGVFKNFVGGD